MDARHLDEDEEEDNVSNSLHTLHNGGDNNATTNETFYSSQSSPQNRKKSPPKNLFDPITTSQTSQATSSSQDTESPDFSTSSLISCSEHYNGESVLDNISPKSPSSPDTPEWSLIDSYHKSKNGGSQKKQKQLSPSAEICTPLANGSPRQFGDGFDEDQEAISSSGNRVVITINNTHNSSRQGSSPASSSYYSSRQAMSPENSIHNGSRPFMSPESYNSSRQAMSPENLNFNNSRQIVSPDSSSNYNGSRHVLSPGGSSTGTITPEVRNSSQHQTGSDVEEDEETEYYNDDKYYVTNDIKVPGVAASQGGSESEESDMESLRSYHPPVKVVDIPSALRLAKRLYNLEGFKKSDVSRHLSRNNEFNQVIIKLTTQEKHNPGCQRVARLLGQTSTGYDWERAVK